MSDYPLYVAIVWHMHQPFYRDLRTGEIAMPWVRLHAAKDYLHMAEVVARHPEVHVTINVVPSLTDQLVAFAEGRESDLLFQLAEKEDWTTDEKRIILGLCYSISWDRVIRRHPRYAELLDRRTEALDEDPRKTKIPDRGGADPDAFTTADTRDLLAWFNLVWLDPGRYRSDSALKALLAKGRDYTQGDILLIHARQRAAAAAVVPLYRQLAERGQVELTVSPYYHPILPLLIDAGSARRPSPGLPLPGLPYLAAEDAAAQLQMAIDSHTRHFGARPRGLWPSEGSVSPETVRLAALAGFDWLASDEVLLGRSLGRAISRDEAGYITDPASLYRPYRLLYEGEVGPAAVFRDHDLSDRIGFIYQHLPGAEAAGDLISRLMEIRRRLDDPTGGPYLVTLILDGENAWEHYEENGDLFLDALYRGLSDHPDLKAVTVGEFLAEHRPGGTLARLATGSWIGGDFTTWIGDPEQNRAWEALARARAELVRVRKEQQGAWGEMPSRSTAGLAAGFQALYAAEGSDWFWWYSHRNSSQQDALFDTLFRHDLMAVYEALGLPIPAELTAPIARRGEVHEAGAVHPSLTVRVRDEPPPLAGGCAPALTAAAYPDGDWALAAVIQPISSGTMQRAGGGFGRLFLCHDGETLYVRLELRDPVAQHEVGLLLGDAAGPAAWRVERPAGQGGGHAGSGDRGSPLLYRAVGDGWEAVGPDEDPRRGMRAAEAGAVLELAVPMAAVGLGRGRDLHVQATLSGRGAAVSRLPERGMASFRIG